jgi:hypothetical protein
MKTKFLAFLATVGVVRSIFISVFCAIFLIWIAAVYYEFIWNAPNEGKIFLISFTLLTFGFFSKATTEMLSWEPQALPTNKKFQKIIDLIIALGLTGMAIFAFVAYYEEVPTFGTIIFGLSELCAVYLVHKNGFYGYFRLFAIMIIALVIFAIHFLIFRYYFGQIMLVGFYIALVVLTKIPEKFYESKIKPRIEKRKQDKAKKTEQERAEKIRQNELAILVNIPLFNLGNMYVYFAEVISGDKEFNKKQTEFYLEAFRSGLKNGKWLTAEDTKYLCYMIGQVKCKLDSEFLNAVIDQCLLSDLGYLVFTTIHGRLPLNEWPVLFKAANKKAALISSYLVSSKQECYDSLFNTETKVFNVDALTGLINCLYHFYQKSDDDLAKDMAKKEVQRLINFAVDCHEQMIFLEPTKDRLKKIILEITNKFWELGIEIEI